MPDFIPPADTAIFNEQILDQVKAFKSFPEAREFVEKVINSNTRAHQANLRKARAMLAKSKSLASLQYGCYNFFLAHQGDAVIR